MNQVHPTSQNALITDEVSPFDADEQKRGNTQPTQLVEGKVVYNISKYHEEQKIDYSKFKNKIDSLHLRNGDNEEYSIWKDLIRGTKIPGHFLWNTSDKTAVDQFGVGITLYFKGLKNLIWLHLVFIIISMPAFIIYSKYNADPLNEVNEIQHGLFISSVGNLGKEIGVGHKPYEEKGNTKFIVAYLDALLIIVYFVFLFIQGRAEKKCTENILNKKLTASTFSVQISNLPPKKDYKEQTENGMRAEIHQFLEKFLGNKFEEEAIIDVKISESQSEILNQKKIGELQKQNEENIYEFLKKYDSAKVITNRDSVKVDELSQVISSLADNTANKKLEKIIKVDESITKSYELVKQAEDASYIRYAWVTFNTLKLKEEALQKLQMTSWQRFVARWFSMCVKTTKLPYFNNKLIKVKESPNPDTILWQNNYATHVKVRRIISTLIVIGVVIASFFLIAFMKEEENALKKMNPPVDCRLPQFDDISEESGKQKVIEENGKGRGYKDESGTERGYIQCFCKENAFSSLDSPLDEICDKWLDTQIKMYTVFISTALIVVVITSITQRILNYLMTFERFRQRGNQMKTIMTKSFIVSFINNGLLVFLVNMYIGIDDVPYLSDGEYDSTDARWFRDVGTVIVLSIIISTVKLMLDPIVAILPKKLMQLYDRKFQNRNPRVTRQTKQDSWVEKYTGPEFDIAIKSATILFFCCLGATYSAGFPIVYCITFVGLLIQYWIDKIYLFKYSTRPLNYDEKLATEFRQVMYFCPFIHCIFSLFTFGCENIFREDRDGETENIETIADTFIQVLFHRKQTIVHTVIFFGAIALFLMNTFLLEPLLKVKEFFIKSKGASQQISADEESKKLEKTFDSYLSYEQICDEIKLINYYKEQQETNPEQQSEHFLKSLCKKLKQYESAKEQQQQQPKAESDIIGIYSYDIRINPAYRNLFCWEKLEK